MPGELVEKAKRYEEALREHHDADGLVVPVVYPPLGEGKPAADFRHATEMTGQYLAALSFRHAVAPDSESHERLRQCVAALGRAVEITGVPGALARAYRRVPGRYAVRDDETGWNPAGEWEWLGPSGYHEWGAVLFGLSACYAVSDSAIRAAVEDQVRLLVGTFVDAGLSIPWAGDRRPPDSEFAPERSPKRFLPLQALFYLKVGYQTTREPRFQDAYMSLIREHAYHTRAVRMWHAPGDYWRSDHDCRSFQAYYVLMQHEDDAEILAGYRKLLDLNWSNVRGTGRALLALIYRALIQDSDAEEEALEALRQFPSSKVDFQPVVGPPPRNFVEPPPLSARPPVLFEWYAAPYRAWYPAAIYCGVDYLLAYWLGRYHRLIGGQD